MRLNREEIMALVPHRPPFLMVDAILEVEPGRSIVGVRSIRRSDPIFEGHFPGQPIYPGVLIAEGLGQTSLVLLKLQDGFEEGLVLVGSWKIRFLRPVVPDAELILKARLERRVGESVMFSGEAEVDGQTVAKGETIASRVDVGHG